VLAASTLRHSGTANLGLNLPPDLVPLGLEVDSTISDVLLISSCSSQPVCMTSISCWLLLWSSQWFLQDPTERHFSHLVVSRVDKRISSTGPNHWMHSSTTFYHEAPGLTNLWILPAAFSFKMSSPCTQRGLFGCHNTLLLFRIIYSFIHSFIHSFIARKSQTHDTFLGSSTIIATSEEDPLLLELTLRQRTISKKDSFVCFDKKGRGFE